MVGKGPWTRCCNGPVPLSYTGRLPPGGTSEYPATSREPPFPIGGRRMSLWNMLKQHAGAQFMEVIDWTDDTRDTIVYRYPTFNQAITDNSKLVVREGQAAVFVSEGQLSEVFGPGSYDLDTRNAPIMRFFQSIMYKICLLYTSPSPRDKRQSRMPSSA